MRTPMRFILVLVATLGLLWAGSVPAQAVVAVSIQPQAKLVAGGAVRTVVEVACDAGREVLEAHVSVTQDDQTISGQAGIPVRCDGKARKYRVTVRPLEGTFHTGDAFVSAFVLTCIDPACLTTEQGQDARTVTVR